MTLKKPNRLAPSVAFGLTLALAFAGCGGDDHEPGAANDATDAANDASELGADDAASDEAADSENEEEISDFTPESFEQLKTLWAGQIEGIAAQATTLRQVEAEHNDQQLKDLIAQLDAKLTELRQTHEEATFPNGGRALQVDIPRLMEEAGEFVQRATERMQQVLREKIGLPGGGGGS